jgi:hypothetical protein
VPIPGEQKKSKIFSFHSKERKPLQGYYDIASWTESYRKKFPVEQHLFDPTNYERQSQALIDLPAILKRDIGTRTDYNSEDPAWRFKDPYSDTYKNRLLNAWYFDPVIQQSIYIRTSNLLGKARQTRLEPDVSVIFDDRLESLTQISDVIKREDQKKLMEYIKLVEKLTMINKRYKYLLMDWFVGGRSALHKRTDKKIIDKYSPKAKEKGFKLHPDTPTNLMELEWWRLGQVKVDRWDDIAKVEYRDASRFAPSESPPEDEKGFGKMIPAEQLIYMTRLEKRYGRSIIQPILSVSEQNRMMNEQDLPEIFKARWAPSGLFTSETMSQEELAEFIEERDPSKDTGVKGKMEYIKLSTDADPEPMTKARHENSRFMLMQTDVPSFMMKMEEITNRATSASVLAAWRSLTLENDRTEFRELMWEQFYQPLIILYMQANGDPDFDIIDFDAKIAYAFQNLTFEDDKVSAEVADLLQKNGIESIVESRRRMNMPLQMEMGEMDIAKEEEEQEQKDLEQEQAQQQLQQQQEDKKPLPLKQEEEQAPDQDQDEEDTQDEANP